MKWTDLPLDRPVATLMLLTSLTVLGAVAVFQLPLGFMPAVQEPEIDIEVPYPGSHPLEGLRQIVRPIEEEVATIPGIKGTFGFARSGHAQIEVQFDWEQDIELKKIEVRDAVERARSQPPEGTGHIRVEGDMGGPSPEVLGGRISAQRDLSESWDLLDRRIRRPLERIQGVARVDLYGVEAQEVRIDLDLAAIQRHGIEIGELMGRVNAANLDLDLGAVRGDLLRYNVRALSRFRDVETVRNLLISDAGIRLKDVAQVSLREPILDYGRHLNRNFAIGFDVYKEPTANTVETVDRLVERIEAIRRDPELQGIEVLVWQNAGEAIRGSLTALRNAGIIGGLLAISVLYLFLRRISTTLIVAIAIPFSLLVTCGAMLILDFEFNVLTMLGLMLGVGMLVDNAVVVIENIYRLQGRGMEPVRAARVGVSQVSLAVLAATATTIIVWSWLFVTPRSDMIIYIGEVAFVICLAVSCSFLISMTFIPLAAARFVPHRAVKPGFLLGRVVPAYRVLMRWTLRHRFLTLFALLLLAGSAAIPFMLIEKSGEPRSRPRDVSIFYRVHDPATKDVMESYVDRVEEWIWAQREELGIESLYSWYSETQGAVTRAYLPRQQSTERAMKRLRDALKQDMPVIAGVELEIDDMRGRFHRGSRKEAVVRIAVHGEDPEYLESLALEVEQRMKGLPDLVEVYGPTLQGRKEVRVTIDPERARQLGLAPDHIANVVGFSFRGRQLRRFQGSRGEIEVRMGLPEENQPGMAALADLPIPIPGGDEGETVKLSAVAQIVEARTPPDIVRIDRKTTRWVTVEFDEDAVTTDVARQRVEERMAGLRLPDGYAWDWGRHWHDENESLKVMGRGIAISLIVVLLLMAALFESFSQPLAILITLPLAFFGAIWAIWLLGFQFDPMVLIGSIILIGIVVNNGIVMVDHVNSLRREGKERVEALIEGCGDRLRPVLMTVITTVFGLAPLSISQFTVAGVFVDSMAVTMIGGLISSTIFTLIALPVWYTTIEDVASVATRTLPHWQGKRPRRVMRGGVLAAEDSD
jgi:HAE1 family hydrophobic/amphiphilic exporter-1